MRILDDEEYDENIPLRSDTVYQYIENIPPYSLSQSIAFLMAIRNQEAKDLLEKTFNIFEEDPEFNKIAKILYDQFGINSECIDAYAELKFRVMLDGRDDIEHIKYTSNIKIMDRNGGQIITDGIVESEVKITKEIIAKLAFYFYRDKDRFSYNESIGCTEIVNNNGQKIILDDNFKIDLFDADFKESIFNYFYEDSPKLRLVYSEPELSLPNMKKVNIDVNLSLSLEQLIEQITAYKELSLNENSIVKSKKEYLEMVISEEDEYKLRKEDIESINKIKKTNTILADKFFVYDVICAKMQNCLNLNQVPIDNYETEIEKIRSANYTIEEEKKKIAEAKKERDDSIIPCEIIEYLKGKDILKALGKSESTIRKYYYEMEKFIEGMEYKRLVSDSH